jgi:aryl-alcohol dehydrogenase-like predicted oxidoreductase
MRTLDDLVRAGKIRYLGFSNTPAWVTAQAHTMALLKGWTPLIAPMHGALRAMLQFAGTTVDGETSTAYPPLVESDVRY